jgi:hypothetical protein
VIESVRRKRILIECPLDKSAYLETVKILVVRVNIPVQEVAKISK